MDLPDEGILNRRTWILVGVLFGLLAVVVLAATIVQPTIKPPRPAVDTAPRPAPVVLNVGDLVKVRITTVASDAAGPPLQGAIPCTMQAGLVGRVVELGGSLSNPRGYAEVSTPECTGWLPVQSLVRP